MKPARRLGRGLDSLITNLTVPAPATEPAATPLRLHAAAPPGEPADPAAAPTTLPTELLAPNPFQPRSNVSQADIASLAQSIERNGLLQPIAVRPAGGGYEIIAGERRWAAAKALGWAAVPVVIREADDRQMLELALIENLQREDLNAVDRARAYREFCMRFSLKPEQVAERLGEDRTTVVNYLRLLELPPGIQAHLAEGRLSMGHARCLLGVSDARRQAALAEDAMTADLSVRALEERVRREKAQPDKLPSQPAVRRPPHLADLERRFEQAVKTKVRIYEGRRKGSGRIVLEYYTLDDFDRISALLQVPADD
ncbi:MAG: ParB/RepB/Spo0J family partition protein [Planctomycetes bacterium]|nr:ParB/RepB/Spo0J family partition protein [Planctomycetota bacterium]